MGKNINVFGTIKNVTGDNIVATADTIKDEVLGKTQREINAETSGMGDELSTMQQNISAQNTKIDSFADDVNTALETANEAKGKADTIQSMLPNVTGGTLADGVAAQVVTNTTKLAQLDTEIFAEKTIEGGEEVLQTKDGVYEGAYIASSGKASYQASGGFTTYYYAVSQGDAIKVDITNTGINNANYSAFALFTEVPSSQGQESVYHVVYDGTKVYEWTVTQDGYLAVGASSTTIANAKVYKTSSGSTVRVSVIGSKTDLPKDTIAESINTKQDILVSGTNIKTVNGQSIIGSGNINIEGGGSGTYANRITALENEIFTEKTIEGGEEVLQTKDGVYEGAYIASSGKASYQASGGFATYYYAVSEGDAVKIDITNTSINNANYSAFALFTEVPSSQGQESVYHVVYDGTKVYEWTVTQDGYLAVGASSTTIANAKVYKTSSGTTVKYSVIGDKTKLPKDTIADSFGGGSYWKGKKVGFFGDSITADGYYWKSWKDKTSANCISYGVAGNTIAMPNAAWASIAMENRVENIDADCDMIVVMGGTNDYGGSAYATFGEFADGANESKYTFYAGLHRMCKKLYARFTDKPVVFITPLQRLSEYSVADDGTITEQTNRNNKTLRDYVNAIKEVAALYNFKVLDAYAESGLANPIIEGYKDDSGTYHGKYFRDGLHPNTAGGTRQAKWMYPLLEEVYEEFYK